MENVIQNPTQQIYNPNPSPRKKNNIFKFVFLYIFGLFIAILATILILNYFKIVELSTIPPFNYIQKQISDQQEYLDNYKVPTTGLYELTGVLKGYNNKTVSIKLDNKSVITIIYNSNSEFFITKNEADEDITIIKFPENVLTKENVGKKVSIVFNIEKNAKILNRLTIK